MAKLLLIQTLFLTICWFALVSGEIDNPEEFKTFIKNKVISTFKPWAKSFKMNQYAVLMLMDTDKDWSTFKFSPKPSDDYKYAVQPKQLSEMVNYVAVIPGMMNIKGKEKWRHSEQYIYDKFLEDMLFDYYNKMKRAPKAIVLYSWAVPCYQQSCPSKGTTGCTSHTIKALKGYAKQMKVIVAYTDSGDNMGKNTKCDTNKTETELTAAGIDVIPINDEENNEAMIENLIKLGRLMQIIE